MKANAQIRQACREKGVYLWELAENLGMHESTLSRKIRSEFSAADRERALKAIDEIAEKKAGEE